MCQNADSDQAALQPQAALSSPGAVSHTHDQSHGQRNSGKLDDLHESLILVTHFLLIRHGETEWNRAQRIQGQRESELSPAGLAQAAALAAHLSNVAADALVSSDLGRTMRTAAPLGRRLGLAVEASSALRERAFGVFEGLTTDQIKHSFPAAYASWRARDPDFVIPGGESLVGLRMRVKAALESIAGRGQKQVIVVTHGGVLDAAYRIAEGIDDRAPRAWVLANAGINRIEIDAGRWRLGAWGEVAHLAGAVDDPV